MAALDRPIREALSGLQSGFAVGTERARAYRAEIGPLAALRDQTPEAMADLGHLVGERGSLLLFNDTAVSVPPGCRVDWRADLLQMVAAADTKPSHRHEILALGDADMAEMLSLARLAVPGPFAAQTHRLGQFYGIRIDGRLAAMAGQRMRLPGHTEVSGICTHPDYRGQGLAHLVSARCAAQIAARGEQPFLHVLAANRSAIRIYESLGFVFRRSFIVSRLVPDP